ncbi:MAG: DUF115 domain-containing protein [Lachnospiraceae bacterium]|nr:DUF115 domain-containing protein [Lachnospiraceae bacterium]
MIKTLYTNNLGILIITKDIISACRAQNYNKVARLFKDWTARVSTLATNIAANGDIFNQDGSNAYANQLMLTISDVLKAQEQEDYILEADILEVNMIPLIYAMQDLLKETAGDEDLSDYFDLNISVLRELNNELAVLIDGYKDNVYKSNKSYVVESTASGFATLKIESASESFYMEGNIDPYRDSINLFDNYYDVNAESYIVLGLGLGYLACAISKKVQDAVPVTIYEPDIRVIYAALGNVNLSYMLGYGYKIVYDPDLTKFAAHIKEKSDKDILIMHHPSIRNIQDENLKDKLEAIFVQDASIRNQMFDMITNFKSNIKNCNHYVDELKDKIAGKDVYIIAAGPSLDENVSLLKNKPENSVIIAVGRVFRKLYNAGISVDYVVFLDSADRIYGQYNGLEETGIPLLIASTTYRKFAVNSKADKYLICQNGMTEAEEYAKKNGFNTYNTGGSVATIAFDIAISLGAKRVITIGLDLAYSESKTHTDGAYGNSISDAVGLIKTKGQDGKMLFTTKAMDIYRIWFEDRIKDAVASGVNTEFINATEGGALISGMINKKLSDVLKG